MFGPRGPFCSVYDWNILGISPGTSGLSRLSWVTPSGDTLLSHRRLTIVLRRRKDRSRMASFALLVGVVCRPEGSGNCGAGDAWRHGIDGRASAAACFWRSRNRKKRPGPPYPSELAVYKKSCCAFVIYGKLLSYYRKYLHCRPSALGAFVVLRDCRNSIRARARPYTLPVNPGCGRCSARAVHSARYMIGISRNFPWNEWGLSRLSRGATVQGDTL